MKSNLKKLIVFILTIFLVGCSNIGDRKSEVVKKATESKVNESSELKEKNTEYMSEESYNSSADNLENKNSERVIYEGRTLSELPIIFIGRWTLERDDNTYVFDLKTGEYSFYVNNEKFPFEKPRSMGLSLVFDTNMTFNKNEYVDSISLETVDGNNGLVTFNYRDGFTSTYDIYKE